MYKKNNVKTVLVSESLILKVPSTCMKEVYEKIWMWIYLLKKGHVTAAINQLCQLIYSA